MLGDILYNTSSDSNSKKYLVLSKLGNGAYAQIWLVKDLESKDLYAIKINKSSINYRNAAIEEIKKYEILNKDTNENVIHMVDHFEYQNRYYQDQYHICIVFELAICDLHNGYTDLFGNFYDDNNIMYPKIYNIITQQILKGVQYIEKCNIIHCDLKLENILFCMSPDTYKDVKKAVNNILEYQSNYSYKQINKVIQKVLNELYNNFLHQCLNNPELISIKITDFGISYIQGTIDNYNIQTIAYRAPEIILKLEYPLITTKIDVWSIGCILFELLTKKRLFTRWGTDIKIIEDIIYYFKIDNFDTMISNLSICDSLDKPNIESIKRILLPSPLNYTIVDRLLDRNIETQDANNISSFLLYILNVDPTKRPSAGDILEALQEVNS